MNVLDLFSGIGGFSLGFERAGMETVAFCEIDPYCRKVLQKHWPGVPIFEDIRKLKGDTIMGKLSESQKEEAISLYQKGMSLQEVGDFFGVSRQSMHDLLKRRIELRPQKRFGKENNFYRGGSSNNAKAHDILEKAILKGIITRPKNCECCGDFYEFKDGRTAIQAHHDDYNRPLDVKWLCQKCHYEWHNNNRPIDKKEVGEIVDCIVGGFPC